MCSIAKRKIAPIVAFLLGVVIWLSPLFVFNANAISGNPQMTISQIASNSADRQRIEELVSIINEDISKQYDNLSDLLTTKNTGSDMTVTFVMSDYRNLPQEDKQKVMSIILNDIQDSRVSASNRTKLYNFIADSDTAVSSLVRQLSNDVTADFASAYAWFKPFSGWLGTLLGLFAIGIFILLAFSIVVDIAYLTIPFIQWFLSKSSDEAKPSLISQEAWSATKEAESKAGQMERSPLGVYFKLKVKEYIILGICLLYLISGEIYTLVAYLVDYFQGLLPS